MHSDGLVPMIVSLSKGIGRVISTLTTGEEEYVAVSQALEVCVSNFNSALSHYGQGVGFKTFEYVEGKFCLLEREC